MKNCFLIFSVWRRLIWNFNNFCYIFLENFSLIKLNEKSRLFHLYFDFPTQKCSVSRVGCGSWIIKPLPASREAIKNKSDFLKFWKFGYIWRDEYSAVKSQKKKK